MLLSILKTLTIIASLFATLPSAVAAAENNAPRTPTDQEIAEAERDALEAEKIKQAQAKISVAVTPTQKLEVVKLALTNFAGQDVSTEAAGNFQAWAHDKSVRMAAINDPEFMNIIESHMLGDDSNTYSARLLSVVYGDLIEEDTSRVRSLNFVEKLLASANNEEKGIRILLSAWAPQSSNLDLYFNSPRIKSAFAKILGGSVQDPARHRLVSFLSAVDGEIDSRVGHPLLGDPEFATLFDAAFSSDEAYRKNLERTRRAAAQENESAEKFRARCMRIVKSLTKWIKPK